MAEKYNAIDHVEKAAHDHHIDNEGRRGSVAKDNAAEHELTFIEVAKHHKMLIWWSFYFAMCAVGWYVQPFHFLPKHQCTDNSAGVLMLKSMAP